MKGTWQGGGRIGLLHQRSNCARCGHLGAAVLQLRGPFQIKCGNTAEFKFANGQSDAKTGANRVAKLDGFSRGWRRALYGPSFRLLSR